MRELQQSRRQVNARGALGISKLACAADFVRPRNSLMQRPVAISYGVFALLLILVAALGLGTPFIAVLFCYLALRKFAFAGRRWIALTLFLILIAGVFVGFVIFVKRASHVFPEIAEESIPRVVKFAEDHGIEPPFTDMESLKAVTIDSVRDAFGQLS